MRIIAKFSVWGLSLSVASLLALGDLAAKDQQYLLNCRLMDHADPIYENFCTGDKAGSKVVCQGNYCVVIRTNYGSRYSGPNETLLAVGDGPSRGDIQQREVAVTQAQTPDPGATPPAGTPNPDGTPPGNDRPTPQ
jgi:hypothetical protein